MKTLGISIRNSIGCHGIVVLFCLSVLLSPVQAEQFIEVLAKMEIASYVVHDTNHQPMERKRSFVARCIVGTNHWRIEEDFVVNAKRAWYFDGTNVYRSMYITSNANPVPVRSFKGPVEMEPDPTRSYVTVTPSPGGHPLGDMGVNLPWLAFASGTYLKMPERIITPITPSTRNRPDSFAYRDNVRVFDDDFGLPKAVQLFTDRDHYKRSLNDPRLERLESIAKEKISPKVLLPKDGLPKLDYEVQDVTNFAGWNLPTRFRMAEYSTDPRSGAWRIYYTCVGTLLSIKESLPPDNVFTPGTNQFVTDRRFRDDKRLLGAISYQLTNTVLAAADDQILQAQFLKAQVRAKRDPAVFAAYAGWIIISLLAFPVVIIAIVFVGRSLGLFKHNKGQTL